MNWDNVHMRALEIVQVIGAALFALLVIILVLINIFGMTGEDIKKILASNPSENIAKQKPTKPKIKAKNKNTNNVVRHYSEFVTVKHPTLGLTVTTGIKYENSTTKKIDSQWCYVQRTKSSKDGLSSHLSLSKIDNGKVKNFAPYSVQTLRELGITQQQAKTLLGSCQFKK